MTHVDFSGKSKHELHEQFESKYMNGPAASAASYSETNRSGEVQASHGLSFALASDD
jgi:hypothetical protein